MKILITGTAGFIGFHLTKKLLEEGNTVVGIDNINDYYDVNLKYARLAETGISRKAEQWYTTVQSSKYKNYTFIRANLEDREQLMELFEKENFNSVCNLAAQAGVRYSIDNPYDYINSNIVGFINILEACRHNNIKHLVYASSSSVYGNSDKMPLSVNDSVDNPVSLYAATKKSNELMAHTYSHLFNIPTTGLRFFTVYGPWGRPDMAPMLFANAISNNLPIKVFNNGDLERDFTYIKDIIEGITRIINNPPFGAKILSSNNIDSLSLSPGRGKSQPGMGSGIDDDKGGSEYQGNEEKVDLNQQPENSSIPLEVGSQQTATHSSQFIAPYKIYNIGKGKPIKLLDFIKTLEIASKKKAKKQFVPMQPGDVYKTFADVNELKKDFGYSPNTSLEKGIGDFVRWYKDYYNCKK